ncbi:right-handed parallel beta-helix repeat-containing protein [Archangium sp.]|uniref:right-handed parallel beta-helix repeat-containing protein n=1 Tax=Archangium sp. TaxID=1872627 RepID=UPI002D5355E0|nr:right-handed parallel beta-helix repeat-containing protein [Archangium sp.]HYO55449.1 right-handed parallel beta-helix repeat-containing protein [Archangium sp.]
MSRKAFQKLALLGALWLPPTLMAAPQAEWTRTLFVANNAIDSATCGTSNAPCRSLSRAIDNARNGDRILVRPGRYGDLNGDGDFNDPGEEAAEVGFGCRCMILVDKRLVIESTDGAAATVLDASGARLDVVNITASHVVFGGNGRGFTLTGARKTGDDDGIGMDVHAARGVRVIGNVALGNRSVGFAIQGSRHTVRNNISSDNGHGFSLGATEEGHLIIIGNVATTNGNDEEFGHGFQISGESQLSVSNRSIGNDGVGFFLYTTNGSEFVFKENDAIGNRGVGIWVQQGPQLELHRNNIFGNLGVAIGGFFPPLPNCGLANNSGSTIDATRNFWGAPTGPGPDPADDAGPESICDRNGMTIVTPFETRPSTLKGEPRPLGDDNND